MRSKSRLPNQGIQIRGILYASILMLVMLLSGSALADDFDGLFRRGMTLYQKKDFEAAIEAFQAAYKVRQFPRVLLNIAQVYRKMGNAQLALDYYQQFIKAEPNPPPKIKVDVEQYIAQTKAMLEGLAEKEADHWHNIWIDCRSRDHRSRRWRRSALSQQASGRTYDL